MERVLGSSVWIVTVNGRLHVQAFTLVSCASRPQTMPNSTARTGQHQKAHNDVIDIPPHQPHNPLPVWVQQIHLHTINKLSHTNSLSGLEGLCQANRGGVEKVKSNDERGHTHPYSCHINGSRKQSIAPERQAQLEASKLASLAHTHTHSHTLHND